MPVAGLDSTAPRGAATGALDGTHPGFQDLTTVGDYVPDPDLTQMVRDLNRTARGTAPRAAGPTGSPDLDRLLAWAAGLRASDLLLVDGCEPVARVDGSLVLADGPLLTADDLDALVGALLDDASLKRLAADRVLDLAFERAGLGRFRCNLHHQGGSLAMAVRLLPEVVPALEDLGLPQAVADLVSLRRGLVLLTGPAGCGKSTTLAALAGRVAASRPCHIITIEDPVEYRLAHGGGLVEQVEVGRDAPSFASALRAALRQSPDVILVGEMRDVETIAVALTAAETGHLVLSTLHTGDAAESVDRIVDAFPPDRRDAVRVQLAGVLRAVISQVLLARGDGRPGRVPACEVLLVNDAVRKRIRKGEGQALHQEIALARGAGMLSLEESLALLVRRGLVPRAEASAWARHPAELDRYLAAP